MRQAFINLVTHLAYRADTQDLYANAHDTPSLYLDPTPVGLSVEAEEAPSA